jgi:uncharacterized membrane protein
MKQTKGYCDMKTFCEMKTLAKSQIKGRIGILLVMHLITFASIYIPCLCISCLMPLVGDLVSNIVAAGFILGLTIVYLKLAKSEDISIGNVFAGFDDLWTAIKAQFFTGLFIFLWSLLLIIPGIIKAFSYSMTFFILAENKGMPVLKAITLSRKMMDGHKLDFLLLSLSFFGWFLLVLFTFGLAAIWVHPYCYATYSNFYLSVKEDYMAKSSD